MAQEKRAPVRPTTLETEIVSVRIGCGVMDKVRQLALAERRSVGAQIGVLVEEALEKR